MDLIAAQARKRFPGFRLIQLDRPHQAVNVMRAAEHMRFQLSQKRYGGHGVPARELPALEQHGLELHHDRVRLLEFPEIAEIRVLPEHVRADVLPVLLPQRGDVLLYHIVEACLIPLRLVRVLYLDPCKRDACALHTILFCDLYHV